MFLKKIRSKEEQRKNDLKKNKERTDLKRHDLEFRRIEEERRDDLVDWTIERWVSQSGRLNAGWTIGRSSLQVCSVEERRRRRKKKCKEEERVEEEGKK